MKIWFTADTHFGSERTLELHKRPFSSVNEMDNAIIDNWNSVVDADDKIYHLGDFGTYSVAEKLNGDIVLLYGNYERKEPPNAEEQSLFHEVKNCPYFYLGVKKPNEPLIEYIMSLMHEPSNMLNIDKGFSLFGHIHRLGMIKKIDTGDQYVYGLNVGTDIHFFKPIDIATVEFFINAAKNHYDDEVYM